MQIFQSPCTLSSAAEIEKAVLRFGKNCTFAVLNAVCNGINNL